MTSAKGVASPEDTPIGPTCDDRVARFLKAFEALPGVHPLFPEIQIGPTARKVGPFELKSSRDSAQHRSLLSNRQPDIDTRDCGRYMKSAARKLGATNRMQATIEAWQLGLFR